MTKYFCDLCKKAVEYENCIQVHGWLKNTNSMYCVDCFQNNKNWNTIHGAIEIKSKSAKITEV